MTPKLSRNLPDSSEKGGVPFRDVTLGFEFQVGTPQGKPPKIFEGRFHRFLVMDAVLHIETMAEPRTFVGIIGGVPLLGSPEERKGP